MIGFGFERVKANLLLKRNIDAILSARGQSRRALARWCRKTDDAKADSWASHIFGPKGYHTREIPTVYLDRIADFFGVTVYQLFQPGISPLTERRKGVERRTRRDRRINQVLASRVLVGRGIAEPILAALDGEELELVRRYRSSSPKKREHLRHVAATDEPQSTAPKTTVLENPPERSQPTGHRAPAARKKTPA